MGYVYLICDPVTEHYKIGVTKGKIENRILELQTGNSSELHITNYHKTPYPFRVEKMLHAEYKKYNVHGEWFELPPNEVMGFNEACQKVENIIEALKDNPFFIKNLK